MLLLQRGIRRGVVTLLRERGWWTSLWALTGVVILAQLFLVVWLGVAGVETLLRTQTDLRLQVQDAATDRQTQEFIAAAQALPIVTDVAFITREQALERERTLNPDLLRFLEQFNIQNPFPDTVAVTLRDLSDYEAFSAFVQQPEWRSVVDHAFLSQATDQELQLRQMLRLTDAGRTVAGIFLSLTGGILLFIVVELVRRRAFLRREEVFVERMSGAQEASVVLPFATEAGLLLAIALGLGLVFLVFFLFALPLLVPALADGGAFALLRTHVSALLFRYGPGLIAMQFVLIPLVGFAGAFLGTRGGRMTLAGV